MKIILKLIFFLFIIINLTSCKKDIGVLLYHDGLERWDKDYELIIENLEKNRIKYNKEKIVKEGTVDPTQTMLEATKKMVKKGIKVLIIIPNNQYKDAEIVKYARRNDIKVVSYDRLIRNCQLDFYVSFDSEETGRLQAEYAVRKKPSGNYVIIGGSMDDNNSFLLKKGQVSVLQPFIDNIKSTDRLELIYDVFTEEWTEQQGEYHMIEAFKTGYSVDVVITACDALARGVIKVIPDTLLSKTIIIGQDADHKNCKMIIDSLQSMTVYKPFDILAKTAVDVSIKLLKNETIQYKEIINNGEINVPSIIIRPLIIDINNIEYEMKINYGV